MLVSATSEQANTTLSFRMNRLLYASSFMPTTLAQSKKREKGMNKKRKSTAMHLIDQSIYLASGLPSNAAGFALRSNSSSSSTGVFLISLSYNCIYLKEKTIGFSYFILVKQLVPSFAFYLLHQKQFSNCLIFQT